MKKEKSLNKNVADFTYKGRKYEIDILLDTGYGGYAAYDIFDVTNDSKGDMVAQLYLEQQTEDDFLPSELIGFAKEEIK